MMLPSVGPHAGSLTLAWALGVCGLPFLGQAAEPQEPRIAIVSVETILEHFPERAAVESKLSKRFAALQSEVDRKWKEVAELNRAFQDDQELLSQKAQAERQQEIIRKETELSEYWNRKADKIKAETEAASAQLSRQVEDQVIAFARDQGYTLIFDKSSGKLIYAADAFDRTEDVMQTILGGSDSPAMNAPEQGADASANEPAAEATTP